MNTRIEDSNILPIESKQGLYYVGEKLYINKLNALAESSRSKQPVTWDFNYSLFDHCAKMPRMEVSLLEIYKQRALQLREKYDYLILSYSGGADSDNILQAFIDNNIKLDEVWTDWPSEITEKSGYVLSISTDPKNMPSEKFLVVEPTLARLKITNPEIKIHFSDANKYYQDTIITEEDILHTFSHPIYFAGIKRHKYIQEYMTTKLEGKNSCLIMGIDKCIPYARNGKYGFVISDNAITLKSNNTLIGIPYTYEFFYWTANFPMIVVEQARKVWDYILDNRQFLQSKLDALFDPNNTLWIDREKSLDQIIKAITYPKWDFNKHQVHKSRHMNNEHYHIVDSFADERFYQGGVSVIKNLYTVLDSSVFDTRRGYETELKPFFNFHILGDIK